MVVQREDGPQVKVLDFGLAIGSDRPSRSSVAGTLLYMAPELFKGGSATEAADLYAVGVIAYQVLAGCYPFDIKHGTARLLEQILQTAPDLAPLPLAMRPVLEKVLSKEPRNRQTDAATLLHQLAAAAGHSLTKEPSASQDSYFLAAHFVGRHVELEELQLALTEALHGAGSAWLIVGESGVGKSRLLEELRSSALQSGALAVRGQAVPGGAAYHVWQDVLALLALQLPLSELELGVLATILPKLPALLGSEPTQLQSLDPASARLQLFRVIDDLLGRLPEPALLLLEDLQWADAESLALLAMVAGNISRRPLLIVASYRANDVVGLEESFPLLRKLHLQRLGRNDMAALCESMLGQVGQDPKLLDLVATETEGNAHFIVEGMRALAADAGSLQSIGLGGLPKSIFAGGITQVLMRRLAQAPVSAQPLLRLAAVAGRQLDVTLLSHLLPSAEAQIHDLADVGLLETSLQQWRFSHDKLREQALHSLSSEERIELHACIAQSIEKIYPGDAGRASQLALHYREAQQLTKAAHFYGEAGEVALRRGAPGEAAVLLEQARTLHSQVAQPRLAEIRVWRGLTEANFGLGRLREAESALRHLCMLGGIPLPTQPAHLLSMITRMGVSLLGSRVGLFRNAKPPDPEHQAILTELLAGLGIQEVFVWTDQPELGLLCTLLGLSIEDKLGLARRRNYHRSALFFILSHTPLRGLCLRYLEDVARRDAQFLSGTHAEIDFLRVRALVEINAGQLQRAAEHATQAVALARTYQDDLALLHSLLQLQLTAAGMEDFPQMLAVGQEMEPLAKRAGDPRYLALAYVGQGAAQLNMGAYSEAAVLLEQARAYLPQELGPIPESVALGLAASAAQHLGQAARATELADQALQAVGRARWDLAQLRHPLVCIAHVYLNTDQPERHLPQLKTTLSRLHRLARRFPHIAADDKLLQGVFLFRMGQPQRACASLRASIEVATKQGTRSETATAQYWLGCLALSPSGRHFVPEGAEPHFRAALATFKQLKAAGMAALIHKAQQGAGP